MVKTDQLVRLFGQMRNYVNMVFLGAFSYFDLQGH